MSNTPMSQETAYQLALEAKRRSAERGLRFIDRETMDAVRREYESGALKLKQEQ